MRISVRYFAALREAVGSAGEALDLADGADVAAAQAALGSRYPTVAPLLPRCAAAVNRTYVPPEMVLREGDELVFIPPLGGGALWLR